MNYQLKTLLIFLSGSILFIVDRTMKYIFSTTSGEYFVLGELLKLKLAYNPGIAFGLLINPILILVFYIFIFIILVWFLVDSFRKKNIFFILSLILIIFGAFSNFLDRIYIGQVIDYIDVRFYSVFNIADVMIVAGVLFLLVKNMKLKVKD